MTARAHELMPFILELLKAKRELSRGEILKSVKPFLDARQYKERDPAADFALSYLVRHGCLRKLRAGLYSITESGFVCLMTEEQAREIEAAHESSN